jgi:hypothetical protein
MRVIAWNQIWFRSAEMNPGTMIGGEPASTATDIGNRRLRFLAYAKYPKIHDLNPFGINNQTFINGGAAGTSGTGGYGAEKKPGFFFMTHGMNMQLYCQKKIRNLVSLRCWIALLHGIRLTMASTLNFNHRRLFLTGL